MAAIRDFAVTEEGTATVSSIDCEMPIHEAGDILVYFASKDGAVAITDPAGIWTSLQDGAAGGIGYRVGWALATGSDHTLTLTTGTAENFCVVVISIKGADTSNPIVTSAESGSDATMPFDGVSGATTGAETNCLILHSIFTDSGLSPTAYAPLVNIYAGDNGANSVGLAYTFQKAAGAITQAVWFGRANDDTYHVVVAVKDDGNLDYVPPYSDPAVSVGQVLRPLVGLSTMFSDSWPTSLSLVALGNDFDECWIYESAPSYTTEIPDINDPGTADVTFPMHNTGDAVYFGSSTPFGSMSLIVSTAGVTGVMAWEYWNGSTWATATGMSDSLTSTGARRMAFTNDTPPANWTSYDVNGATLYWVRCRITTTYTTAVVVTQGRRDGYTAAYLVATAAADAGTNPYTDAAKNAGTSSKVAVYGHQLNFGSSLDMDTGIIYGTYRGTLPRDLGIDIAVPLKKPGGVQVTFYDTNNYYLSYIVGAKRAKTIDPSGRNLYAIDWNGSATPWATCGSIAKGAVTKMLMSTLGYYGACAIEWSMLSLVSILAVAGGTADYPLDLEDIAYAINNCVGLFPFVRLSGGAAMFYVPVQFGGGDPVSIECNLNSFQFPALYDGEDYFDWNAAADVAGVKFYPKTGDVLKFMNCVFTSPASYRWEFDASSASSGWTGDFTGTSVVGAAVVLRDVFTFDQMTFIDCPSFAQNAAPLTNCRFQNTKVTVSAPADAEDIQNCDFVSGGTGHAIEIGGTAADIDLTGLTFTGYSGTSTNAAIYVNIASGTMTISILGGGDTPSIRTAGCVVTVINSVTVKVTVKDAVTLAVIQNARVYLIDDDETEIFNDLTDVNGEVETTYNFSEEIAVTGRVRKSSGSPYYKTSDITGSIISSGFDVTILMIEDE